MSLDKDYLKDLFTDEVKGCLEGDSSLPKVTSEDDGKILKVVDGTWRLVDLVPPLYLSFLGNAEFTLGTANNTKNWDGTLEYSTNKKTWSEWDGTAISSAGNNLYLRGTGNTKITGFSIDYRFVFTGTDTLKIACEGNIETLLDYKTVRDGNHPTMAKACYAYMFAGCTALTTAPALPATTLADHCYANMFQDCTKIKLSTIQTGDYQTEYKIPTTGTGTTASGALTDMFANTGGTFTGTPEINNTYYTSNTVV